MWTGIKKAKTEAASDGLFSPFEISSNKEKISGESGLRVSG
jgi:hypothetical protein